MFSKSTWLWMAYYNYAVGKEKLCIQSCRTGNHADVA